MRWVYYLGIFVPVALGLKLAEASAPLVFFASAVAVVPGAAVMSDANQEVSARSGPGVAGLLNVTFGNAPERRRRVDVVEGVQLLGVYALLGVVFYYA